jgi:hypothetical protein
VIPYRKRSHAAIYLSNDMVGGCPQIRTSNREETGVGLSQSARESTVAARFLAV